MIQTRSQLWQIEQIGDAYVIDFLYQSLLDPLNIESFGRELVELAAVCERPKFVIRFANLQNFSSSVLSAVIRVYKQIRTCEGELRLAEIPEQFVEVFRIAKLDKLTKIYPTTEAALVKF